jgi:hypothetical protein
MSERALEFVETWVQEAIEDMDELPAAGDESKTKALALACIKAAREEGIPESEIKEAFDDLGAFIGGQVDEERDREEHEEEDDDDDDNDDDDDELIEDDENEDDDEKADKN